MIEWINKFCLVKPEKKKNKTEGGIEIPDIAQEKPTKGVLIGFDKSLLKDFSIKEGDIIHYPDYSGIIFQEEFVLLRIEEIWGFEKNA
jgi:co-chaperonin GroES (HSP10)